MRVGKVDRSPADIARPEALFARNNTDLCRLPGEQRRGHRQGDGDAQIGGDENDQRDREESQPLAPRRLARPSLTEFIAHQRAGVDEGENRRKDQRRRVDRGEVGRSGHEAEAEELRDEGRRRIASWMTHSVREWCLRRRQDPTERVCQLIGGRCRFRPIEPPARDSRSIKKSKELLWEPSQINSKLQYGGEEAKNRRDGCKYYPCDQSNVFCPFSEVLLL